MGGKISKKKSLFTTSMDTDLVNAARNCVAALIGTQHELRLSDLFDKAVRAELQRQQGLTNNGAPFPQRKEKSLKAGRPFNKKGRATIKK